jgi:hypothetical protein
MVYAVYAYVCITEISKVSEAIYMILATLKTIGANANIILYFGAGILGVYILGSMLVTAIQAIKEFLNQT